MTRASIHPTEAWTWMSFLLQHQEASTVLILPFVSQIASEGYASRASEDGLAVARGLPRNIQFTRISDATALWRNNITDLYLQTIKQVVLGKVDAQSALNEAQKQAEGLFQDR